MMPVGWLLALMLLLGPQRTTIRGTVVDALTSLPIHDAQVTLVEAGRSTRTSPDGRFEFPDVAPGTHTMTVSTIGYIFVRRRVDATANAVLDLPIPLAEGTGTYKETVTVSAEAARPPNAGVSLAELGSAGLADLRGVAADDPMRAMQALPGVATGDDFQAEFSVRGSAFRHVGVVLEGTATPMLIHAVRGREDTGSIAMINTDILSRGMLLTGPHPPRHGDWLGATLEFDMREGSRDRAAVRAAVSGTSASTVLEGPLGPDKRGSWLVSLRKSYIDWLIRKLEPGIDSTIGFLDGQGKIVYDLTRRMQVQFAIVGGHATYKEEQTSVANGLLNARSSSGLMSAAWRYASRRWVLAQRVSFVGSDFRNRGLLGQELARGYTQSINARLDVSSALGRGWTLEAGGHRDRYRMNQILRDYVAIAGGTQVRVRDDRETSAKTTLLAGWGQVSRRTRLAGLTAGVRVTSRTMSDRSVVLPWILAERSIGPVTLRAGAGRSAQFPDPSLVYGHDTDTVRPERATSFDAGLEHRLTGTVRWQLIAFKRSESDVLRLLGETLLDPVRGVRIAGATFPSFAPSLSGTSRGVDVVLARRAASGLTGWIGYTWARTRQRDRLTGEEFDADFDQRHTLNVFALHRLSYRMTIGAKLRVGSNFPLVGYFENDVDVLRLSALRNRVRLPMYARLDLRANRTFTFDRRRLTLFVEVMNALGRRNLGQSDGSIRPTLEAVGFIERLIPLVPSAGFLIEF